MILYLIFTLSKMSAEDRLTKLTEEQLLHLNSLKEKLEKIDTMTSKREWFNNTYNRGQSVRRPCPQDPGGNLRVAHSSQRGTFLDYRSLLCCRPEPKRRYPCFIISCDSLRFLETHRGRRGSQQAEGGEQQAQVQNWLPVENNQ